jgi:hypothetical protein
MLTALLLTIFLGAAHDLPFDPAGSWSLETGSGLATLVLDIGGHGGTATCHREQS